MQMKTLKRNWRHVSICFCCHIRHADGNCVGVLLICILEAAFGLEIERLISCYGIVDLLGKWRDLKRCFQWSHVPLCLRLLLL